jgi:hypothetical protein
MTVPDDIIANYETADYIVFRKIKEDGSFLPVYKSKDVEVNGNTVSATVTNRRIAVSDGNGKDIEDVIAVEYARDETSITYLIVAAIEKWDDEDMAGTYDGEAIMIYLKVDNKTKQGTIVDIKPVNEEETNTSGKVTYNLNDWRTIKFVSYSYKMYDENGKKLAEWEPTEYIRGTEVSIADGFKFFATSFDDEEEYYYMFKFVDTQGNKYETDLVKAK